MTRINVIPPKELTRQHLLAEYRELPRVFTLAENWFNRGCHGRMPMEYTLGPGHVKFFYNRLGYLRKRFAEIVEEMERRGYKPQYKVAPRAFVPGEMHSDWEPTQAAIDINKARIAERLGKAEINNG